MVSLLSLDRVQYVWNEDTGERSPLCYLYFCKYCLDIRAADNLQHEVDSHYCSQSLDGVPSTEAILKKNKSANCWQCPSCPHALSTRATTVVTPDSEDSTKQNTKKSYYQACSFCRWTSREVGIEDKVSASGGWNEKEDYNVPRINEIIDYYKHIVQKEIQENKMSKRRGYKSLTMQLQQKYGATVKTGRKLHPASPLNALASRMRESAKEAEIKPSETLPFEEIEALPEGTYSQNVDFTKIVPLAKRLDQPEHQPTEVCQYFPKRTSMFIKRSLRCKQCEHNVIKPEYHPSSIKFKIQLVAIHFVPEIRMHDVPQLQSGVRAKITLVAINRTDHVTNITLSPTIAENVNYPVANSVCEVPPVSLTVSQFDEAAEFDSSIDEMGKKPQDDPEVILFRKANKLGFYVWCTPDTNLSPDEDVWISFSMKYDHYSNMSLLLQQKIEDSIPEPEANWLCHKVFINLGKVSAQN